MKSSYFTKRISIVKNWVATALLCLAAITFVWQGAFVVNTAALASPATDLIASTNAGDRAQEKARTDAGRTKNFVRDTADQLEQTADKNANRVERATDDKGGFFARKAKRDAGRIEKRAERDAARTEKAIDNTKNAVERTVDSIKDTFKN